MIASCPIFFWQERTATSLRKLEISYKDSLLKEQEVERILIHILPPVQALPQHFFDKNFDAVRHDLSELAQLADQAQMEALADTRTAALEVPWLPPSTYYLSHDPQIQYALYNTAHLHQ